MKEEEAAAEYLILNQWKFMKEMNWKCSAAKTLQSIFLASCMHVI